MVTISHISVIVHYDVLCLFKLQIPQTLLLHVSSVFLRPVSRIMQLDFPKEETKIRSFSSNF